MSSTIPLGKLASEDAGRDAIHIAVAPVVAAATLAPGDHVGVEADGRASKTSKHIGIVDPYLKASVKPGDRFYLCLYPNTITSLRHHWVHPAFKEEAPPAKADFDKAESEAWLREYAIRFKSYATDNEDAYQMLISDLRERRICYQGSDMHGLGDLEDANELSHHASVVLGTPINFHDYGWTFTCSC